MECERKRTRGGSARGGNVSRQDCSNDDDMEKEEEEEEEKPHSAELKKARKIEGKESSSSEESEYRASQDLFDQDEEESTTKMEERESVKKEKEEAMEVDAKEQETIIPCAGQRRREPIGKDADVENEGSKLEPEPEKPSIRTDEIDDVPTWKGVPLSSLRSTLLINPPHPGASHRKETIFVRFPPPNGGRGGFEPFPDPQYATPDVWNDQFVRMPFSEESYFPVENPIKKKKELKKRWKLILMALSKTIDTSSQLEETIFSYNIRGRWDFNGLHEYFECLDEKECGVFFQSILREMIQLCLKVKSVITQPILLLRRHMNHSLTFSQSQIASLLANAFFCTYPRRNAVGKRTEYSEFPDINFNKLFSNLSAEYQAEKLQCIINYFRRISTKRKEDNMLVTFRRKSLSSERLPKWSESEKTMPKLHIDSKGTIEGDGFGMIQIDFANAYVGGGVLGHGCVQEEIRFLISPELILSRLFTERLGDRECLIITGFERFSDYTGYSSTFRFTGNFEDPTPIDEESFHRKTRLVAIDALMFRTRREQFSKENIVRELNKAYVGFECSDESHPVAVATGNWGCGAFGGDPLLKSLLQLMSAAEAGRDLAYFTFGDKKLRDDIFDMYSFLCEKKVTVGKLFLIICEYRKIMRDSASYDLHTHIYNALNYDAETDEDVEMKVENGCSAETEDDKVVIKNGPKNCTTEKEEPGQPDVKSNNQISLEDNNYLSEADTENSEMNKPSLHLTLKEKSVDKLLNPSDRVETSQTESKRRESALEKLERNSRCKQNDADQGRRRSEERKKEKDKQKKIPDFFGRKNSI